MRNGCNTARLLGRYGLLLLLALFILPHAEAAERRLRNVIVMVPDGCGAAHTTAARWYKGVPLALDGMYMGAVRTYNANSLITDSAPAATAFASGYKTSDRFIGILPDEVSMPGVPAIGDGLKYKPVATVLEGARLAGKSVGLVVTSNVQHATPAAFSAHWPDRSDYNEIAEQQVYQNMDVVLGGGKKYLLPKEKGGTRADGEDLVEVLRSRGYTFVETRSDLLKVNGKKVWGLFADDYLANSLDRPRLRPQEPTLAEMTRKAIEVLSKNPKGFFLLVEGSKVDWAAHGHDPVGVISEVLAFDTAAGVALDFAKKNRRTLVLAFTDHGTGGMSIGSKGSDKTFTRLSYDAVFGPLKKATLTAEGLEKMLDGDLSDEKIKAVVGEYYGINDLKAEEIKAVQAMKKTPARAFGPIMSRRTSIGWTTTGHTGEDVLLYQYGLARPVGMVENTEIARLVAKAGGFDLRRADDRLFVEAHEAMRKFGAVVSIDKSNHENPVLVVKKGGFTAEFPVSKNLMRLSPAGETYALEGITVLAPKTGKVYIPAQAVKFIKEAAKK